MLVVVSGVIAFPECHQKPLAVVGKFENLMMDVVSNPDIVLGIIGTDRDRMRPASILEEFVPLRPRLDHLTGCIDDNNAVAKLGCCRRCLLAERTPVPVKIIWQFFRQLQLAAVGDKNSVRGLREDAAGGTPDISGFG